MFADLVKKVDFFAVKYSAGIPNEGDRKRFKEELLDLIQTAVDHGEAKDQNKIVGIAGKLIKSFMGGKE